MGYLYAKTNNKEEEAVKYYQQPIKLAESLPKKEYIDQGGWSAAAKVLLLVIPE